jgi:hypothetical protein
VRLEVTGKPDSNVRTAGVVVGGVLGLLGGELGSQDRPAKGTHHLDVDELDQVGVVTHRGRG